MNRRTEPSIADIQQALSEGRIRECNVELPNGVKLKNISNNDARRAKELLANIGPIRSPSETEHDRAICALHERLASWHQQISDAKQQIERAWQTTQAAATVAPLDRKQRPVSRAESPRSHPFASSPSSASRGWVIAPNAKITSLRCC